MYNVDLSAWETIEQTSKCNMLVRLIASLTPTCDPYDKSILSQSMVMNDTVVKPSLAAATEEYEV